MEKYARQAVSEGLQRSEDIHVNKDSEIYRVLNLHYNRNNHIEVNIRANIACVAYAAIFEKKIFAQYYDCIKYFFVY